MEMDREILFKAKRKDNGKWVEGYYIYHIKRIICPFGDSIKPEDEQHVIMQDGFSDWNMPRNTVVYEIDPETLCQYTGLTDKNGQKIWENDILKAHLDENYPEDITYTKIIWSECRFCTKENHSSDVETLKKWDGEYFEVCGNIFDNPELLEVV